ncbi:DNA primase family protein [Cytobacillus massiliigabonensis]|uniref:DNA primase family protein n=1 Tax=Cytobacillus massiliigabonensis TaxID=1871011 RepID=UPI000C81A65C|nr:DNA primase family protein [Cytobacillus massiliigabonensis]
MAILNVSNNNANDNFMEEVKRREQELFAKMANKPSDTMIDEDIWGEEETQEPEKVEQQKKIKIIPKKEVEVKPYIYKDEKGKERINLGVFSEYIIQKYPAIIVGGWMFFYRNGFYQKGRHKEENTIIKRELGIKFFNRNLIEETVYLWKIDDRVSKEEEDLNPDPYILNVKNGLLDLRTMEVKPHTPEYISTIQINANYNPNAKSIYFKKFLNEAVPDMQIQQVLSEIIGYSLTFFYNSKKRIFLFYGQKNTGKSTILNVTLEALLPKVAKLHRQLTEFADDKYAGADLLGKTVNIYGDLSSKALTDTGTMKNLTGKDGISAQHKFGHSFDFVNKSKFVFSTNKLPQNSSSDTSDAFYERVMIIPFEKQKKQDEIDETLERNIIDNDLDYILLWVIAGLKKFINSGFKFTDSAEIQRRVANYEKENNTVLQFVEDCCVVGEDEYVTPNDFMKLYELYCEKELEQDSKIKKNVLAIIKAKFDIITRSDNDAAGRIPGTKISAWKGVGIDFEKLNDFHYLINLPLENYVKFKQLANAKKNGR